MKKYNIQFLTQKGIIEMIISESDDLAKIETILQKEYGNFTTLSSTEIK